MKKNIGLVKISLLLLAAFSCLNILHAQNIKDTTAKYLKELIASDKPQDKVILNSKLEALAASNKEADLRLAEQIYYQLNMVSKTDSLQKAELIKFPLGVAARNKAEQAVFNEKEPEAAETAYRKWIGKFPPSNFPDKDHDHIVYDYARSMIAQLYANKKNIAKAEAFVNMLEEDFWKGNGYGGLAEVFYKNGDLPRAEIYTKKAMESAKSFLNATDNAGKFAASGYPGLCNKYVGILYEEKKYDEALKYIDTVYKLNKGVNLGTNYMYAKLLMRDKKYEDAYVKLDEAMKTGKASKEIDSTFKVLYPKVKGSYAGYDEYMKGIHIIAENNLRETVQKAMMDKPAPMFTLYDVNGKKVSLSQFKGKVVVLDFWATWCGPCKRSFPAMQMAQDKYKNDPNVKFLFIHTWERGDNATAEAKKYIQDNHYNFEVLMDLKDPKTKDNKVVRSYGITGIPAKFIIDPKGNIRFHLTGFDGDNEEAVNEISMMIEMASNQS